MDITDIVTAFLNPHLADGLKERQRFDIAHGTAHLDQRHIGTLGTALYQVLDLVGNVRDHLNGFTQVLAPAFLLDHRFVHLAGRKVITLAHPCAGKALVVAQIQVGFGPVFRHEHFAVLEGTHRPGVNVNIGIEF